MTFPRASAFVEVAWTPLDKKDYTNFKARLLQHSKRLDKLKEEYAPYFKTEKAVASKK